MLYFYNKVTEITRIYTIKALDSFPVSHTDVKVHDNAGQNTYK